MKFLPRGRHRLSRHYLWIENTKFNFSLQNSQAVAYETSSLADLLPVLHYVPRLKVDVSKPNAVHQADLLFLHYDKLPPAAKLSYPC